MFQDYICVEEVQYGDGLAEVIGLTIRTSGRNKRRIILTFVPPKTNTWRLEKHKEMQKEVLKCIDNIIRKDKKAMLVGDFNCKGVNWEEMEVNNNADVWSEEVLQLAMVNTLDQWVEECTRHRGDEEPSMLDLVFTKKKNRISTYHHILKSNG